MTKSSYLLLIGIALMLLIGAEVWWYTGSGTDQLTTTTQIATPIATVSSTNVTASSTASSTKISATPTSTKP